jgi:ankyrin repeat protein
MKPRAWDHSDPENDTTVWFISHAETGRLDACMQFLDRGVSPNKKGPEGELPLLQAVLRGHADVAFALIERGADILARDDMGDCVLHKAMRLSESDIRRLIELGADVNARNKTNTTPLMCMSTDAQVRVLLERGADPNIAHNNGNTPFMNAAMGKNKSRCMLLAQFGANVNAGVGFSGGSLHHCMLKNDPEMGAFLVALGAKPLSRHSGRNRDWRRLMALPPLHAAARSGHLPLVLSMVKSLEDLDARHARKTPEMIARDFRKNDVMSALQSLRASFVMASIFAPDQPIRPSTPA